MQYWKCKFFAISLLYRVQITRSSINGMDQAVEASNAGRQAGRQAQHVCSHDVVAMMPATMDGSKTTQGQAKAPVRQRHSLQIWPRQCGRKTSQFLISVIHQIIDKRAPQDVTGLSKNTTLMLHATQRTDGGRTRDSHSHPTTE